MLKIKQIKTYFIILFLILGITIVSYAEVITVKSTVEIASDGRSADLKPTEFSVPDGKLAVIVKYFLENAIGKEPKKNDKLGDSQIFSFSTSKYIPVSYDQNGNAITTLPSGKYSFKVGGYPGAYGTLALEFKDVIKKSGINLKSSKIH
ncbi:MAG: hypothetical protein HQK79_11120 [Desulfobacterales bacterium]|nr:hypothetical protein [Desulfobacterales bacterium]